MACPFQARGRHFLDSLSAGRDIYSEKTMTWSIPEAEDCLKAAKNSDRVVQIGLQHESDGSLADAKQGIKQGIVGKATMVESWMSRNRKHGHGQWVADGPPN